MNPNYLTDKNIADIIKHYDNGNISEVNKILEKTVAVNCATCVNNLHEWVIYWKSKAK